MGQSRLDIFEDIERNDRRHVDFNDAGWIVEFASPGITDPIPSCVPINLRPKEAEELTEQGYKGSHLPTENRS